MLSDLRELLARHAQAVDGPSNDEEIAVAGELADAVRSLLDEPTNVQALALARLMRDWPNEQVVIHRDGAFNLPNDHWQAVVGLDGIINRRRPTVYGIAPDGSVSSL